MLSPKVLAKHGTGFRTRGSVNSTHTLPFSYIVQSNIPPPGQCRKRTHTHSYLYVLRGAGRGEPAAGQGWQAKKARRRPGGDDAVVVRIRKSHQRPWSTATRNPSFANNKVGHGVHLRRGGRKRTCSASAACIYLTVLVVISHQLPLSSFFIILLPPQCMELDCFNKSFLSLACPRPSHPHFGSVGRLVSRDLWRTPEGCPIISPGPGLGRVPSQPRPQALARLADLLTSPDISVGT